jgi:ABC-2 family transporter
VSRPPYRGLPSGRRVRLVLGFELREALRSRLISFVLLLYGVGAAISAWLFLQALLGAERVARDALVQSLGVPASQVPEDLVRRQALPGIVTSLVEDPALREQLLSMDPLAIFYGFMALSVVSGLVLITSGSAHAADLSTGAARFVLTRCDRLSWALGKALGHAALLAVGLAAGALATLAVSVWVRGELDLATARDLLRTSLWAWLYGACFVGIFSGVSLIAGVPTRARTLSLVVLFALWLGHKLCVMAALSERLPAGQWLAWAFPAQYEALLWSPEPARFLLGLVGLLALGSFGFLLGHRVFQRRDA